jgi:GGDEF domain-containing protein
VTRTLNRLAVKALMSLGRRSGKGSVRAEKALYRAKENGREQVQQAA